MLFVEISLALVFSGLIGWQREYRGHGAGLRTHVMVALGACLIMQVSVGAPEFLSIGATRDPARLAAQVVSGIGFLGAGTIIQNGMNIRGLTTAATIWLCGGIGLACGAGYFTAAFIATAVAYLSLIAFLRLERKVTRKSPRIILIVNQEVNLKTVLNIADHYGIVVKDLRSDRLKGKNVKYRVSIVILPVATEELNKFTDELIDEVNPEDCSVIRK